ncbi:hypothetical protein Pelo_17105 [Pelomyxa schiedti]|nr:hypothetical protein Pelo_17105 [Pelomyxa schiedti]
MEFLFLPDRSSKELPQYVSRRCAQMNQCPFAPNDNPVESLLLLISRAIRLDSNAIDLSKSVAKWFLRNAQLPLATGKSLSSSSFWSTCTDSNLLLRLSGESMPHLLPWLLYAIAKLCLILVSAARPECVRFGSGNVIVSLALDFEKGEAVPMENFADSAASQLLLVRETTGPALPLVLLSNLTQMNPEYFYSVRPLEIETDLHLPPPSSNWVKPTKKTQENLDLVPKSQNKGKPGGDRSITFLFTKPCAPSRGNRCPPILRNMKEAEERRKMSI